MAIWNRKPAPNGAPQGYGQQNGNSPFLDNPTNRTAQPVTAPPASAPNAPAAPSTALGRANQAAMAAATPAGVDPALWQRAAQLAKRPRPGMFQAGMQVGSTADISRIYNQLASQAGAGAQQQPGAGAPAASSPTAAGGSIWGGSPGGRVSAPQDQQQGIQLTPNSGSFGSALIPKNTQVAGNTRESSVMGDAAQAGQIMSALERVSQGQPLTVNGGSAATGSGGFTGNLGGNTGVTGGSTGMGTATAGSASAPTTWDVLTGVNAGGVNSHLNSSNPNYDPNNTTITQTAGPTTDRAAAAAAAAANGYTDIEGAGSLTAGPYVDRLAGFDTSQWGTNARGSNTHKNSAGKIMSRYDPAQPGAVQRMMADPDFKALFPNAKLVPGGNQDKIDFGDGNPVDVLYAATPDGAGQKWTWQTDQNSAGATATGATGATGASSFGMNSQSAAALGMDPTTASQMFAALQSGSGGGASTASIEAMLDALGLRPRDTAQPRQV